MPTYDVECKACGYAGAIVLKLAELAAWDEARACPSCQEGSTGFRRVIKRAPATVGGARVTDSSHKASLKERFNRSGERDDMRHKAAGRADRDQAAAARESVKKGEFEGF